MSLAETLGWDRIANVVDVFYTRIQHHPTLAEPFSKVPDWPHHKERLTYFWWVALGGPQTGRFRYQVSEKHYERGFSRPLLADWLVLFEQTLAETVPEHAATWRALAARMGEGLATANEQLTELRRDNPSAHLVNVGHYRGGRQS